MGVHVTSGRKGRVRLGGVACQIERGQQRPKAGFFCGNKGPVRRTERRGPGPCLEGHPRRNLAQGLSDGVGPDVFVLRIMRVERWHIGRKMRLLPKDGLDQRALGRLLADEGISRREVLDAPGAAVGGVIYVLRSQLGLAHLLSHVPHVQADGLLEAGYFVLLLVGEWVGERESWEGFDLCH